MIGKQATIYTDGSCIGNPGPGGWAAVILRDCRFGTILCLAYARDNTGECLPTIKAEGDTLYYALRKDFHIKRNLGHT